MKFLEKDVLLVLKQNFKGAYAWMLPTLAIALIVSALAFGAEAVAPGGKTKILVGTSGLVHPYTIFNEKNELTGIDVELTKEIFNRLPEYELEFYVADLTSLFIALDTNKIQMVAHNVGKNPDRLKKYVYAKKPHNRGVPVIAVKKGRTDIKTVDDLRGKIVPTVGDGALAELFFEKYNEGEAKDNPVKLQYNVDIQSGLLGVHTGKYDAAQTNAAAVETLKKTYGIELDTYPIPRGHELNNGDGGYLIYRPDQTKLKAKVDRVFEDIKADGTLSKIFLRFYEQDYSKLLDD